MRNENKHTIKNLAADDRPREKMLAKGKASLSNAELIAILIRSGNKEKSAIDLAREILGSVKNNLIELSNLSIADLMKHKGIGEAKAISIVSALELGKRHRRSEAVMLPRITGSKDAYEHLCTFISDYKRENFITLLLNRSNQVIKVEQISQGGVTGTIADPKLIFKSALLNNATGIILCHNHPSGDNNPSSADMELTHKLCNAGKLLDISVLDHLIIGLETYYSFADNGILN